MKRGGTTKKNAGAGPAPAAAGQSARPALSAPATIAAPARARSTSEPAASAQPTGTADEIAELALPPTEESASDMVSEAAVELAPVDETALDRIASPEQHLVTYRDPVRSFVVEARRRARLGENEERELGRAARDRGDIEAARRLVVHNLRLVVAISYQYRQAWLSVLDLFQEGSVGLMEAVRRWDPEIGTRFGTYASYWIRAYILRFLMTNARLIHVGNTRAGRKLFFRLERERQKLLATGFDPTPKLLAAKLDVDEADVIEVSDHLASREVSLDPRPDEEGVSLSERLSRPEASPEDLAARNELAGALRRLMDDFESKLPDERERAVWREHLANPSSEPVPLAALGERYGVSKQRMGQIAEKLKREFRDRVIAELGSDLQMSWQTGD
ncbi:MAG: sigma-70 family RNA polymerase sigma factor [Polyangia bacterium]|jgi:RNA polymerase sigma-32 factor